MAFIVTTDSSSGKLHRLPNTSQSGEQGQAGRRRMALSLRALLRLLIVGVLAALLLQAAWRPLPEPLELAILDATRGQRFDLAAWEVDAIAGKLGDSVRNPTVGLAEEQAVQMVREHLRLAQRAG